MDVEKEEETKQKPNHQGRVLSERVMVVCTQSLGQIHEVS